MASPVTSPPRTLNRDSCPGVSSWSLFLLTLSPWLAAACAGPAAGSGGGSGTLAQRTETSLADRLRSVDVVSVRLTPDDPRVAARVRVADPEGTLRESRAPEPGLTVAGVPVRFGFTHAGDSSLASDTELTLAALGEGQIGPAEVLALFAEDDRAYVTLEPAGSEPLELGLGPIAFHRRTLLRLDRAATTVPAAAPFLDGAAAAPASTHPVDDGLLAFCERELLVRRPAASIPAGSLAASAWFGGLVALSSANEDAAVRALPAVMEDLYSEERAAGGAEPAPDRRGVDGRAAEWAVPRWLLLRERMGTAPFRSFLRDVVDEHRGGAAIGLATLADAAERAAPDLGARFIRSWMTTRVSPKIRTQWRYDGSRRRVLMRVDQMHELVDGRTAPAFPLRLPVRIVGENGEALERVLSVEKRRDLMEIPVEFTPTDVLVDPMDALAELVDLAVDPAK